MVDWSYLGTIEVGMLFSVRLTLANEIQEDGTVSWDFFDQGLILALVWSSTGRNPIVPWSLPHRRVFSSKGHRGTRSPLLRPGSSRIGKARVGDARIKVVREPCLWILLGFLSRDILCESFLSFPYDYFSVSFFVFISPSLGAFFRTLYFFAFLFFHSLSRDHRLTLFFNNLGCKVSRKMN